MEFWGIEVPANKPTVCTTGDGAYLHLTQAALGEVKSANGNERVVIRVKVGEIEVVLGTLSHGKCDQMSMDLIFDTDFSISHNGKSSIYLSGYRTEASPEDYYMSSEDEEGSEEEDDEAEPSQPTVTTVKANGDGSGKGNSQPASSSKGEFVITEKAAVAAGKIAAAQAKKLKEMKKLEKQGYTDLHLETESDEDEDEDEDDKSDEEMAVPGGSGPFLTDLVSDEDEDDDSFDGDLEDDDSEEISDDEDEDDDDEEMSDDDEDEHDSEMETPTLKAGKKRAALTTPNATGKKVRMDTPAKPALGANGDKKSKTASATPSLKTPQKEQKTPKDKKVQADTSTEKAAKSTPSTPASAKKAGQYKCKGCDRSFVSEAALSQHSAAKHKAS